MVRLGVIHCGACGATTSVLNWTVTQLIIMALSIGAILTALAFLIPV